MQGHHQLARQLGDQDGAARDAPEVRPPFSPPSQRTMSHGLRCSRRWPHEQRGDPPSVVPRTLPKFAFAFPNDEWFYSEKCKSIVQELDAQKLRECMLVRSPASLMCPPLAEAAYGRFSACSTSWTHCEHRSSGYGHQTSRGSSSWQVRAMHMAGLRACSAQGWRLGFGADVRKQLVDQTQRADSAEAESAQLRASLRREKFSFELERMNQIQVH